MKWVAYDVQTGGGESGDASRHSLLTAYFCVIDDNLQIIADLEIKVVPENSIYHIHKSMSIDLVAHSKGALTQVEAYNKLAHFLCTHFPKVSEPRFVLNVNPAAKSFIVPKLTSSHLHPLNLAGYLSGEEVVLSSLSAMLKAKGRLPEMMEIDSKNVAALLGVVWDGSNMKTKMASNVKLLKALLQYVA